METPSLLITDDDRALRETLRDVFADRGFRTLLAGDGEEAVEIVRRNQIHLVVMDLNLPRMTGLEAVRRMRVLHAPLPWILMSGELDDRVIDEAQRLDAASVFSKPLRCRELAGAVCGALRDAYGWEGERT